MVVERGKGEKEKYKSHNEIVSAGKEIIDRKIV